MNKLCNVNIKTAFAAYIVIDTFFVGMGMGVPFFCILFGFPVGWYLSKRVTLHENNLSDILSKILKYALYSSIFTFILMIVIWGLPITMLLGNGVNFEDYGMPLILYDPKISFIGWIILMIFISPFLQILTTIFASNVTLWSLSKKERWRIDK